MKPLRISLLCIGLALVLSCIAAEYAHFEERGKENVAFWSAAVSLGITTGLDIQSGSNMPATFHETSRVGGTYGQALVSGGVFALSYWAHKSRNRPTRWLGTAFLGGMAGAHLGAAAHNWRVK